MTPLEKMQMLEVILQKLFERIQWSGDSEAIELANEALTKVAELQALEKLLMEIF